MSQTAKKLFTVLSLASGLLTAWYIAATPLHQPPARPKSAEELLNRADILSWTNRWAQAKPYYAKAATVFREQHKPSRALYAEVSEIPADESASIPANILRLTEALPTPAGRDPATRLRILTIRGMLEINYDAGEAIKTWREIEASALKQGQVRLSTRAGGEQGIAAFLLGDTVTARSKVLRAWALSIVERDPAATVRYASVFGGGLVQIHRYKEAMTPLDKAISTAKDHSEVAYPTIAVYAKINALAGLHQYPQALQLANASLKRLEGTSYDGHKTDVYTALGDIKREQGDYAAAIPDYQRAISLCEKIGYYRGIVNTGGELAVTYEQQGKLPEAVAAIDTAIQANTHIPDELYLVPRNLAIKADIELKMGQARKADDLYRKSMALVNMMLRHSPTINVQRQLLTEMSGVYSGYFAALCSERRYNEALQILDNVRGRVEAEALQHHEFERIHEPTADDRKLTQLNLSLINTDDLASRASIAGAIYNTELFMTPSFVAEQSVAHPTSLSGLQRTLGPNTLLVEYVLAEPASYVLAVTRDSVQHYRLASREQIEEDAARYRKEIRAQKEDKPLAHKLFNELLKPVTEYSRKPDLIIIPDGFLHLLPFTALRDDSGYVLATHTLDVNPSATVYALLHKRAGGVQKASMSYVGVAAWTQPADTRNPIYRAIAGPERSGLVSLPDSKQEVESIARDLPSPSTILEGAAATETRFKQLPLQSTEVVHLALHGYADLDYPDRSALIFAPDASGTNDGLLQVREIREMHLNSKLVTLSACDTGVGPVGESGVSNLVNAFIEAGADSVVSTLWELADQPTSKLMQTFYAGLAAHDRKGDALRSAQLELLNEGLPPYFWASFQLVGDANGTL